MNLPGILLDEALRRHEFPVAAERTFLAHAAVCPLPRCVAEAIAGYTVQASQNDQEEAATGLVRDTRSLVAQLLKVQPTEIALVGPTSLGLSLVANGLSFEPKANVVACFEDYPSNVYPWMALQDRGVEIRFLKTASLGRIEVDDVLREVDGQTRLVSVASCHFVSGWRPDIDAIGRELRRRGVLFCVDGIQTLGAFPTPLDHVDFLAADAHKWLLGPCGSGVLYVRKEVQDQLAPTVHGWHNLACPDFVARPELVFRDDARRYEAGSAGLVGIAGFRAALSLLLKVGVENVARELLRKRQRLLDGLLAAGMKVLGPDTSAAHASGILSFQPPDGETTRLHQRLTAENIVTSLRTERSGRRHLRLSPHFYNTDAELDQMLEVIRRSR
jgi:selenocysteine lyase/cysteine desulfurase